MLDALRIVFVAKPADYQMQVKSRLSKVGAELIQQVSSHSAHYIFHQPRDVLCWSKRATTTACRSDGCIKVLHAHPCSSLGCQTFLQQRGNAQAYLAVFTDFLDVQDVADAAKLLDKVTGLNVAVCEPFYLGIIRQLWAEK